MFPIKHIYKKLFLLFLLHFCYKKKQTRKKSNESFEDKNKEGERERIEYNRPVNICNWKYQERKIKRMEMYCKKKTFFTL